MVKPESAGTVARNTLWMFCGLGLRLVIQALYFVVIARSLGASGYGAFIGSSLSLASSFPSGIWAAAACS